MILEQKAKQLAKTKSKKSTPYWKDKSGRTTRNADEVLEVFREDESPTFFHSPDEPARVIKVLSEILSKLDVVAKASETKH